MNAFGVSDLLDPANDSAQGDLQAGVFWSRFVPGERGCGCLHVLACW